MMKEDEKTWFPQMTVYLTVATLIAALIVAYEVSIRIVNATTTRTTEPT